MKNLVVFIQILLLAQVARSNHEAGLVGRIEPIVRTSQGLIRGIQSAQGDFASFLGIPYAQVNASNPFGAALPAPTFDGVFQAYNAHVACPQMFNQRAWTKSLDCLRLNVYVPDGADSHNPLPVMVFVPGGGYLLGKSGEYYGELLVKQGIILVVMNYRLGPYGFLCLNTPEVPGNQGLKDQVAALRWIRQNIGAFGGNPDRVTLVGHSAGSSSVNLHLYSSNEPLFQQAIMQSATAAPLSLIFPNDESPAINLAAQIGFRTTDTGAALQFLSTAHFDTVTAAAEQLNLILGPCIERTDGDSFLTSHPLLTPYPEKTINLPVMIGGTSSELYGYIDFGYSSSFKNTIDTLFDLDEAELDELAELVRHFYAGNETDSTALELAVQQLDADLTFNYPLAQELNKLVEETTGPIYSYIYEYVSVNDAGDRPTMRAQHTAELKYLFLFSEATETGYGEFNEEEQEVSDRICRLWANFVRHGNPTPSFSARPLWPAVAAPARPHMTIGLDNRVEYGFMHAVTAFWELFYDAYKDYARALRY